MKCSVYIATSVDGFIAKPDGDIEWLNRPEYSISKLKGLSYDEFISNVDALVMGRHTYEKILSFGAWPYELPVVVLTRKGLQIPEHLSDRVTTDSGDPKLIISKLEAEGKKHLYIDGGKTIQQFLDAGLIQEMTLTKIPILLGSGIPLFGSLGREIPLKMTETHVSENGFVQVRYEVHPVHNNSVQPTAFDGG